MYTIRQDLNNLPIDGLQKRKLFRNETVELLGFSLEKDAVFPEHSSPKEAVLLVLEGRIRFHIGGSEYLLGKQEFLPFPAKTPHWVKADVPSKFLIIR